MNMKEFALFLGFVFVAVVSFCVAKWLDERPVSKVGQVWMAQATDPFDETGYADSVIGVKGKWVRYIRKNAQGDSLRAYTELNFTTGRNLVQ